MIKLLKIYLFYIFGLIFLFVITVYPNDSCCRRALVSCFLKYQIPINTYLIFLMKNNIFGLLLFIIILFESYLINILRLNVFFKIYSLRNIHHIIFQSYALNE